MLDVEINTESKPLANQGIMSSGVVAGDPGSSRRCPRSAAPVPTTRRSSRTGCPQTDLREASTAACPSRDAGWRSFRSNRFLLIGLPGPGDRRIDQPGLRQIHPFHRWAEQQVAGRPGRGRVRRVPHGTCPHQESGPALRALRGIAPNGQKASRFRPGRRSVDGRAGREHAAARPYAPPQDRIAAVSSR